MVIRVIIDHHNRYGEERLCRFSLVWRMIGSGAGGEGGVQRIGRDAMRCDAMEHGNVTSVPVMMRVRASNALASCFVQ